MQELYEGNARRVCNVMDIDADALSDGMYQVRISSNSYLAVKKLSSPTDWTAGSTAEAAPGSGAASCFSAGGYLRHPLRRNHDSMPHFDQGQTMPDSPIRKLAPFAVAAKAAGRQVLHLNIGQPDIATLQVALDAVKGMDRTVIEYSPATALPPTGRGSPDTIHPLALTSRPNRSS